MSFTKRPHRLHPAVLYVLFMMLLGIAAAHDVEKEPGVTLTPEERAWLDENPEKLTLYYNVNLPPIESETDDGKFVGLSVDISARIEKKLGVKFIRKPSSDWLAHIEALKSGEAAMVAAIASTPERSKFAFFTSQYATLPIVIIARKDHADNVKLADFAGKRVGVAAGFATEEFVKSRAAEGGFEVVTTANATSGLHMVAFGQLDAFVEDISIASHYIDKESIPRLKVVGETDFILMLSLGVSRKYPLLFNAVRKALETISESELVKMRNRHITLNWDQGLDEETVMALKLTALFTFLLVVCLTLITIILKKRLNERVAELQKSEIKYKRLTENSPAVVYQFTISPSGEYSFPYINESVSTLTNLRAEDVMRDASLLLDIIYKDDRETLDQGIQKSARDLSPLHLVIRHMSNGRLKWIESRSTPKRTPGGGCLWDGFFHDVTERKQAEEALRESERRAGLQREAITQLAFDPDVASADLSVALERVAKVMVETIGASRASIWKIDPDSGQNRCTALYPVSDEDEFIAFQIEDYPEFFRMMDKNKSLVTEDVQNAPSLRELYDDYLKPREIVSVMAMSIVAGGTLAGVVAFEQTGEKRRWHSDEQAFAGAIASLVGQLFVNAERKRSEEERDKLQTQLTHAQKMESVGRLAGGVAHDFNNMLGVILGHTEMAIEETGGTGPIHDNLEEIQKAATRSADLTRQLLAFARKQTIIPKSLDLNEVVGGMLRMLQRLIGEEIDLIWNPGPVLWPVMMDPSQIDQLVANLCVNARDAIDGSGKIEIQTKNAVFDELSVGNHNDCHPGDYVMLAISDNGHGMDKETLAFIYEPFFTTKKTGEGTGLGLATIYGVVKQNNGTITVYSEPDVGTTFKIYLPRCETPEEKTAAPPTKEEPARGRETILLTEDEPAILDMTTRMLGNLGYTVLPAKSPQAAIEKAKSHEGAIDLLLTDIIMPGMNGRELAAELAAANPGLKRIFMSGYTAEIIAHRGVLEEGVNFIQKPFSRLELAKKIREALGGKTPSSS